MPHNAIDAAVLNDLQILALIGLCLLISPYIAKFLRLPISATELLLGAVVAYFGLFNDSENFKLMANIGFYYLMFIAGMEVNLRDLFSMNKSIAKRAFAYIILLYLSSLLVVFLFDINLIFLLIIPVMSVGLLSILFKEFGKNCTWLNTSMLVATLAEVVSIIALTITAAFLKESSGLFESLKSIVYLLIFLLASLLGFKLLKMLFWWYPQLKIILMPKEDKNEKDVRFCIAVFIFISIIMLLSDLEIVLGAFIAGSFIATFFNHNEGLEHKLSSIGYGFLIPIFFIHIGSTFDLRMLSDIQIVFKALILSIAMMSVRTLSSLVFISNLGLKNTLLFALSHSMPLTLLIAVATLSHVAKLISTELYSALILTAFLEAILSMSLIRFISTFKKS